MIPARLTIMDPLPIPSRSSLMSISPAPEIPPSHNSPSNTLVDPTTALISLMYQTLQQNVTLMAHLQNHPSTPPVQLTSISPIYKPHLSPFPKWYGALPTTPLFLTQVATYKSEAYYSVVHDWTRKTKANIHPSVPVPISSDVLASLLREVLSIFLNNTRFDPDRIAMFYHLLTHLNPSSS